MESLQNQSKNKGGKNVVKKSPKYTASNLDQRKNRKKNKKKKNKGGKSENANRSKAGKVTETLMNNNTSANVKRSDAGKVTETLINNNASAKRAGENFQRKRKKKTSTEISKTDQLINILRTKGRKEKETSLTSGHFDNVMNKVGACGLTPLQMCAKSNTCGFMLLKIMVQKMNANVNLQNERGETALHCAVKSQNKEKVWILLQSGAKWNIPDRDGNTPLHHAAKCQRIDILNMLVQKASKNDMNLTNNWGYTVLHFAGENPVSRKDNRVMDMLVKAGANPVATNKFGKTPLHRATQMGYPVALAYLITLPETKNFSGIFELCPWDGLKKLICYLIRKEMKMIFESRLTEKYDGLRENINFDLTLKPRNGVLSEDFYMASFGGDTL